MRLSGHQVDKREVQLVGSKPLFKRPAPTNNYSSLFTDVSPMVRQLDIRAGNSIEVKTGSNWAGRHAGQDMFGKIGYQDLFVPRAASPCSPRATVNKSQILSGLESLELLEVIGKGSFGRVYRCLDRRDGLHKALKVVDMKSKRPNSTEVELMKNLGRQNLSVPIMYESWVQDRKQYILMELCEQDLSSYMKKSKIAGKMSENDIIEFATKLLQVIHQLHVEGYVHMDIKPGKILIDLRKYINEIETISPQQRA